tara:strand:+ start:186 stop:383 length:198 start_codon:yes stop_codon:yes gene_type:complete
MTAREQAEQLLNDRPQGLPTLTTANRALIYAIMDLADAVREQQSSGSEMVVQELRYNLRGWLCRQ